MKYKYFLILFAGLFTQSVKAQEFKLNKSTGSIIIDLNSAIIEAYPGNEIIVMGTDEADDSLDSRNVIFEGFKNRSVVLRPRNERNRGLRVLSPLGFIDNTGLGVSVTEESDQVKIMQVSKGSGRKILVKVPKSMPIKFNSTNMYDAGTIQFSNISSEIEASASYNKIKLNNVTGPMTIKTLYNEIEGNLPEGIKGPISLISAYNDVDIKIVPTVNANASLYAPYGEVYTDPSIKIKVETNPNAVRSYKNDVIKAIIGNGGPELSIKANYGKIYIRTQ
jgi:hypothetical protein